MNLRNEIEECCMQLESNKITERKKSCERLSNLLEKPEVIAILNGSYSTTWNGVISSIQECLRKDADKIIEDQKKKSCLNAKYPSTELFIQVIKTATTQADDKIDVSAVLYYILGCMKDSKMQKCYEMTFLFVLKEYILQDLKCHGRLQSQDWSDLLRFLKCKCEEKDLDTLVLKCFMLLIKFGPSSGLSASILREQFNFITKLCQVISQNSPTSKHEDLLDIALEFSLHTAKDNRVSCCKFGEDVFANLVDLYEFNGREAKVKRQLVEFFLLQIYIHHPNGVAEGHPCAYAFSWSTWRKCLKMIHSLLTKEIALFFKFSQRNTSFFITSGELMVLLNTFSTLFVEVSRQLFLCPDLDVTMSCMQGTEKRQKVELTMQSYINNIQETKSWLWIHIVCSITKAYPELLHADDYLNLLQILSTMQIECNDLNVTNNVYICLAAMLDIHNAINFDVYQSKIDKLWRVIGENTLRTFGLNHRHKLATEALLEKLIPRRIIDLELFLRPYMSGVLNVSTQSIKAMRTALRYLNFANQDLLMKETLMNCILNMQNVKDYDYLLHPMTAKFLINLVLKQWACDEDIEEATDVDKYSSIKDVYFKSLLKDILIPNRSTNVVTETNFHVDLESSQLLFRLLENCINKTNTKLVEHLLSIIVLLMNIIDYMMELKILSENNINEYPMTKLIARILNYNFVKNIDLHINTNDRGIKSILPSVRILDLIFSYRNSFLAAKVKERVPFEMLRSLIEVLNDIQEDVKENSSLKFELKKAITKAIAGFSCISDGPMNENQENILEVIVTSSYNFNSDNDYALMLIFLDTLKQSKPGVMSDVVFGSVLKVVEEICITRYHCCDNAVEILSVLHHLYPHLAHITDESIKSTSVALLKPFYESRDQYGPTVSSALLDCVKQLCQVDPGSIFSRWSDVEIIRYVPEFLRNDYQEIRLKAVETLVTFFEVTSKSKRVCDFHRQEEMFLLMYEKSLEVFTITEGITQQRRTDEIIFRTASVLHTFTTIIFCCPTWTEECLFALCKLAYIKNLGSVDKVLELVNQHVYANKEENWIEKYLDNVLEKWLIEGYTIDNFPYRIFHCSSKVEFYVKYFEICVPLFIVTDKNEIIAAGKAVGLSEIDIVEKFCPKMFGKALCNNENENLQDLISQNRSLTYCVDLLGIEGVKKSLINNLDELIINLLTGITDDKYIYDRFDETIIFPKKQLTVQRFRVCINFVEAFLCDDNNVVVFLIGNNLQALEKVLLVLKLNMYNVYTTDDKLKSFHRYMAWLVAILDVLHNNSGFHSFFIRDTIYFLINLIENHKDNLTIVSGTCKFLQLFLVKILPGFANTLEKFMVYVVNSLKNYAIQINAVTNVCMQILNLLIVDNASHLVNAIRKLNEFPQDPKFDSVRNVHCRIKYGRRNPSLEDKISMFLENEDFSTNHDSLVNLRHSLCKEKHELETLYSKLRDIRGFSEDCEESLLHRLICRLAKMSYSTNENVKLEAIKCLGELGPANLMTLVLQPEKEASHINCSPIELLSGNIVSLLSEYIISADITLVKAAREAFCVVLGYKEGRKMAESNLNFGYGNVDKEYFSPYFPSSRSTSSSNAAVVSEVFVAKIDDDNLWCPNDKTCHENWIVTLVTSLLETFTNKSYLPKLIPVCKITPMFCEQLLPLVVNLLVNLNNKNVTNVLSKNIDGFFTNHWSFSVPNYAGHDSRVIFNKKSVKCMLNVVSFVRLQRSYVKYRAGQVYELELNYLAVAKAAEFCAAHFTALLYSELWCQAKIQTIENMKDSSECVIDSTILDFIYENEDEEVGAALQNILRNAYKAIGDVDALPGCGVSFLLKSQFRVEHYKELGKWDQVTHFYETQVSLGVDSARKDLVDSLKKCNLYQLPLLCVAQTEDIQYECLWRLGQWNSEKKYVIQSSDSLNPVDFEKYRFFALKSVHESNEYAFAVANKLQTSCVIQQLKHTNLESSQNIYPILSQLQSVNEMEDFAECAKTGSFDDVLTKWKLQAELIRGNDFHYVEPIITQRIVLLSDYLKAQRNDVLKKYLVDTLLDFAALAKDEGQFHVATMNIGKLQVMSDLLDDVKARIELMDAQVSWCNGFKSVTRHILSKLCKNEGINPILRSAALKLSGQYMSETFSENRNTIISEFFLKSIALNKTVDKNSDDYKSVLDTYDRLAQFADKEYQQIMMYMKSDFFQRKVINMAKAKETGSSIRKQRSKTEDEYTAANIHVKQSNIDEIEINTSKEERNRFLKLALHYYLLNLMHTDTNNIRIFRIMALYLENRNNVVISDTLNKILPSYKYITMLPQLIPHITESNSDLYSTKVNEIVEKCAIEHPHHTLPLLCSLANANKDREFSDAKTKTSSNDTRVAIANNLLKKLKRRKDLAEYVDKMQYLSRSLIELAYYTESYTNERKKEFNIPRSQKILSIKDYDDVLLPTYKLPVSKTSNYSNIVGITSFNSVYHPVGGKNAPKRIRCRGTDGKLRSQLLKGQDDLRQDAVMQQVFNIMNSLLTSNKQTRNLLIRTYKIVPLSMRSGILEWVDNSIPIGDYLVGEKEQQGAHHLYRPNDKLPSSCRQLIKKCADKSTEEKLQTYKTICKQLKPVFHKFFEVSFLHPAIWYERRRAYTHSVATTSMCGYILGIGDRHVNNILIDKTSAEVIHIDFGIAFEQGMVLPTPETVPFRLTRDVVDGMGVSGVDGIFRRSCEKTMEVLRQNSQTIIAILEVLLYDPLYVWTVTSAEANKRQTDDENCVNNFADPDEDSTTVNITAERALLRLREKLQGTEQGNPTSIEHQVSTLIQQAVDPANLCKLFNGWQAYL